MNQIRIAENIVVDMGMCLESFPCKHSVIINGNKALMMVGKFIKCSRKIKWMYIPIFLLIALKN
jgi:hypothetical protein